MTIKSVYQNLFGKHGPIDGNVIDMSEHGRAGGLSSKQGFKYTGSIKESLQLAEDSGDANILYVGKSYPGALSSASVWQIMSINSTSGVIITYADGDDNYDNEYDERENLSYS